MSNLVSYVKRVIKKSVRLTNTSHPKHTPMSQIKLAFITCNPARGSCQLGGSAVYNFPKYLAQWDCYPSSSDAICLSTIQTMLISNKDLEQSFFGAWRPGLWSSAFRQPSPYSVRSLMSLVSTPQKSSSLLWHSCTHTQSCLCCFSNHV